MNVGSLAGLPTRNNNIKYVKLIVDCKGNYISVALSFFVLFASRMNFKHFKVIELWEKCTC